VTEVYDVAIVGAGTAGLAALREVRKRTDRFVLINDGPYGTTCARVGCMPSKTLIEAARAFHRRKAFTEFGIRGAADLAVDLPAVLARVRRLRDDFVRGTLRATEDLGERNIPGRARLEGPGELSVNGQRLRARRIILATGSRPDVPQAWASLGDRVLTTDSLFEQVNMPPRVAVVGMGPIGAEMGQALARLGIEVTGFGMEASIAGLTDPEVQKAALESLRADLHVHLGPPAELEAEGGGVRVTSGDASVVVDKVLAATGRRPNVEGLGLDRLMVPLDDRGLPRFDPGTLQIADLPVFFAGDVNGRIPLLHEAADDGHIAGRNATAEGPDCYERRTPLAIVFTDPDIAVVGRSWASLRGEETVEGEVDFSRQGRARAAVKNRGRLRVYARKESGFLLGAELCVPEGEHLAHLLALAMQHELSVADLLRAPVYHPVLEEGLRAALRRLAKALPEPPGSDLAGCHDFEIDALD
jgi:dihydrolipoamide dehydrogenase